jgi:hypothetical protein
MKRDPSVLVALIGETRASELTADSFRTNLLEPLGADLALCIREDEASNPFHEWASHLWTVPEQRGINTLYDDAVRDSSWRALLDVDPVFFGGIPDSPHPQVASVAILFYYRWALWNALRRDGLTDRYDWIVLTRSDLMWPAPHPDLGGLSERGIYLLDGEQYGGVCDRHFAIPKRHFEAVLGRLVQPIFTDPVGLRRRIAETMKRQDWTQFNIERFLAMRLRDEGLWGRLRYMPYLPYAVRAPGGSTTWSVGVYNHDLGYYVKYPTEKQRSEIARELLPDAASWRTYLSPLRGVLLRRRLRRAYEDRGLWERAFTARGAAQRARRRLRLRAGNARLAAETAAGRLLRTVPGMRAVLDSRLQRNRDVWEEEG